tara:strand:- start:687 stop:920 length:234 start_codon:yes stop_codon:yes gene_type:complete
MNKSLNKYKKEKWINTRLSRRYKARSFFRKCQLYSILAQSTGQISAIKSSSQGDRESKNIAIANIVFRTAVALGLVK